MTLPPILRNIIDKHNKKGASSQDIFVYLAELVSLNTIKKWIDRSDLGDLRGSVSPGRKKSVRTIENIRKVQVMLNKDKAREISRKLNINQKTVRNIIHNDLNLKTYKKRKTPHLTAKHIKGRIKFARFWRKNFYDKILARKNIEGIMFSDEKLFSIQGKDKLHRILRIVK